MFMQRVYLDTSVPSAYFDSDKLERQEQTREFWGKLKGFEVFVSEIVVRELDRVKDKSLRDKLLGMIKDFKVLKTAREARELAEAYLNEGIIPRSYLDDANHIAVASVNGMDFLVSWNFKHIVNVKTKKMVNLVNLRKGYKTIEIIAPPEF